MNLQMLEERYLKVTKMYGLVVGTWPFQSPCRKRLHLIFYFFIAISSVTFMISNIVVFFSMQTLTDQIPFLMIAMAMVVKHSNFLINGNKFKDLLGSMLSDWQDEKTQDEERIMEMYAERGVFFAFIYSLNTYFCSVVFLLLPLMPRVMDVLVPLNESRPLVQMYSGYYFVENEDDYYFIIILYTMVSLLTAMSTYIATDTTLIFLIQHACGLFALSGHRFKNSLSQSYSVKTDSSRAQETYSRVCRAIDTHKRALAFLNEIEDIYDLNLFVQVGMIIVAFTLSLLKVTSVTLNMETYQYYSYVIVQVVHVFFLTIQGQFLIDSHNSVYADGYEAQWYNVECKTQALFILILRQNLTAPNLKAGGLLELNLDTFARIVKMCISYFTVLKSA